MAAFLFIWQAKIRLGWLFLQRHYSLVYWQKLAKNYLFLSVVGAMGLFFISWLGRQQVWLLPAQIVFYLFLPFCWFQEFKNIRRNRQGLTVLGNSYQHPFYASHHELQKMSPQKREFWSRRIAQDKHQFLSLLAQEIQRNCGDLELTLFNLQQRYQNILIRTGGQNDLCQNVIYARLFYYQHQYGMHKSAMIRLKNVGVDLIEFFEQPFLLEVIKQAGFLDHTNQIETISSHALLQVIRQELAFIP